MEEQLNRPVTTHPPDIQPRENTLNINVNRQTKHEIKRAINQLKNGKAAGPDGVPAEAVKADTYIIVDIFYNLLGKIWNEESVPSDWKHGHFIKLPKKGDLGECKKFRRSPYFLFQVKS